MNEEYCSKCQSLECVCINKQFKHHQELKYKCNSCNMKVEEVNHKNMCINCS